MEKIKKNPGDGDIFAVPLYLPAYQKWREGFDEFIDYRKYRFREDDLYAFGRIIEPYDHKSVYLMEIFRYVGKLRTAPETIRESGRMFEPVLAGGMFGRGRWRILFENPDYDKWKDSDYGNISFLYPSEIWKGGESTPISSGQYHELFKSGDIPCPAIRGSVGIECEIRRMLEEQGTDLGYERTVEERREEYPHPRDVDRKLKEELRPFKWLSEAGTYTLTFQADVLEMGKGASVFSRMPESGYGWERAARAYLEENMPELKKKLVFDCEADTFSVRSCTKKALKEFALAFHRFCMECLSPAMPEE